ncbi:hypothetical protein ES702_04783 [subsurface metagenome]
MPEEKVYPISVNAAAKKYGIPQSTLAKWAAKGRITVLVRPERHGQKMLVDETSVIAALDHRKHYLPRANPGQLTQPPLIKYCPYCGKPLPYQA